LSGDYAFKTERGYGAHLPDLPRCVAAGATLEEPTDLFRGDTRMHLAAMAEEGEDSAAHDER
jgi:predicted RNase H-like HicB family nuclease